MRRRERILTDAYQRAGAGPGATTAVPAAIRSAIDALVRAHQSNIDLSGEDRLSAVRQSMLQQCPNTVEDDQLLRSLEHAVCESASWEPPDIIDGAESELSALHARGLKLAVVSNTGLAPGRYVERALCERGLDRWIEHWIWSDDVRSWKPGRAIFTETLARLNVNAGEAAFVGDTPEADILGAQSAGFAAAVQVGDKQDGAMPPEIALPSIDGLTAALVSADLL